MMPVPSGLLIIFCADGIQAFRARIADRFDAAWCI